MDNRASEVANELTVGIMWNDAVQIKQATESLLQLKKERDKHPEYVDVIYQPTLSQVSKLLSQRGILPGLTIVDVNTDHSLLAMDKSLHMYKVRANGELEPIKRPENSPARTTSENGKQNAKQAAPATEALSPKQLQEKQQELKDKLQEIQKSKGDLSNREGQLLSKRDELRAKQNIVDAESRENQINTKCFLRARAAAEKMEQGLAWDFSSVQTTIDELARSKRSTGSQEYDLTLSKLSNELINRGWLPNNVRIIDADAQSHNLTLMVKNNPSLRATMNSQGDIHTDTAFDPRLLGKASERRLLLPLPGAKEREQMEERRVREQSQKKQIELEQAQAELRQNQQQLERQEQQLKQQQEQVRKQELELRQQQDELRLQAQRRHVE